METNIDVIVDVFLVAIQYIESNCKVLSAGIDCAFGGLLFNFFFLFFLLFLYYIERKNSIYNNNCLISHNK